MVHMNALGAQLPIRYPTITGAGAWRAQFKALRSTLRSAALLLPCCNTSDHSRITATAEYAAPRSCGPRYLLLFGLLRPPCTLLGARVCSSRQRITSHRHRMVIKAGQERPRKV